MDTFQLYRRVTINGQETDFKQVHLPSKLIDALKEIMLRLHSQRLWIYYSAEIDERENPRKVTIEMDECDLIPDPDSFIATIAEELSRVMNTH